MNKQYFAKKLVEARKRAGLTQTGLARVLGVSTQAVQHWEKGETMPRMGRLPEIAQALGSVSLASLSASSFIAGEGSGNDDYVIVPKLSVTPDTEGTKVVGGVMLDVNWIRLNLPSADPDKLTVVSVSGDSMEDTFSHGDLLIVDSSVREVTSDGVYVFRADGMLYMKRIQRLPGGVFRVISDNRKHYDPFDLKPSEHSDFLVFGRVLYTWQGKNV